MPSIVVGISATQFLQLGAEAMEETMFAVGRFTGEEVDLNGLTLAFKGRVTMPAIVCHFERHHAAGAGHDLIGVIFHIIRTSQHPQATGFRRPFLIQVNQEGDIS